MVDLINILVADDHALLRGALCDVLQSEPDLNVVAEASSGQTAVELAIQLCPQVVILDVEMPGQAATTTLEQIRDLCGDPDVLILSVHDDPHLIQEFLNLGVSGYLHKSATRGALVSAIRMARRSDRRNVTMSVSRQSITASRPEPHGRGSLSAREIQVLSHVARARSNRQIARSLGITEGTVKRHLRNIFDKLGAVSRMDAVNKAVATSLIDPPAA